MNNLNLKELKTILSNYKKEHTIKITGLKKDDLIKLINNFNMLEKLNINNLSNYTEKPMKESKPKVIKEPKTKVIKEPKTKVIKEPKEAKEAKPTISLKERVIQDKDEYNKELNKKLYGDDIFHNFYANHLFDVHNKLQEKPMLNKIAEWMENYPDVLRRLKEFLNDKWKYIKQGNARDGNIYPEQIIQHDLKYSSLSKEERHKLRNSFNSFKINVGEPFFSSEFLKSIIKKYGYETVLFSIAKAFVDIKPKVKDYIKTLLYDFDYKNNKVVLKK